MMRKTFLLFLMSILTTVTMAQRQLYISPSGKDSNDGLSPETAWKGFSKVLSNLQAGDVVNIMPGIYTSQDTYRPLIDLKENHSGAADRFVTFRAYDPDDRPVFSAGGKGVWQCVKVNASYIIFDGIEMGGNNQGLDSLEADKIAYDYKYNGVANWNDLAVYNTNGISIGAGGQNSAFPHHVVIRNCIVHDFPGGGIGAQQADYLTFENNIVYNNAWFNMYACSGISILTPVNSDDETGYKNVITGNVVYNNHTKIKWYASNNPRFSDGNGIIIDVNLAPDAGSTPEVIADGAYRAKTLVANNVCYFNGGSGIHAFKAQNVDIVNNSAFMNEQRYDGEYGEIFSQSGKSNRIANNIMYSKPNGNCTNFGNTGGALFYNNIYYNGQLHGASGNFRQADPKFLLCPSSLAADADFHIAGDSPAVGYGIMLDCVPETDMDGRPRTTRVDAGAYQAIDHSGIHHVEEQSPVSKSCYNLNGQQVSADTWALIITAGKKYVRK